MEPNPYEAPKVHDQIISRQPPKSVAYRLLTAFWVFAACACTFPIALGWADQFSVPLACIALVLFGAAGGGVFRRMRLGAAIGFVLVVAVVLFAIATVVYDEMTGIRGAEALFMG